MQPYNKIKMHFMLICNLVPSDARILSDLRLGVEVASSHHNGRFAHLVSQTYISLKNKRLSNRVFLQPLLQQRRLTRNSSEIAKVWSKRYSPDMNFTTIPGSLDVWIQKHRKLSWMEWFLTLNMKIKRIYRHSIWRSTALRTDPAFLQKGKRSITTSQNISNNMLKYAITQ